jgi:hypothetical protein
MSLTGKTPADTYKDMLTIENNNSGVNGSTRIIKTGNGNESSLRISDRALKVKSVTDNTTALDVQNSSGTSKLIVDTTNDQVKALGHHVNTQYANFGIGNFDSLNFAANTHHPIPFVTNDVGGSGTQDDITFGTSTEPATTFTTANGTGQYASSLTGVIWYLPDAISIDGVYSIEGADSGSGDTTRMHLYSYTFTSGSTSALTSGTLLAHNDDVTNAGSEQAYLTTWTVDSASVSAGKVIVAFFRQDSTNSDYSLNITVKYHLT